MNDNLDYVGLQFFAGGQSADRKVGSRHQFWNSRHVDFRKNPSKVTLLPGPTKATASVVTDLVIDMCLLPNGKYYAVGDTGNIYLIGTDGAWERAYTLGQPGTGIIYRGDTDCVYIAGTTKLGRIKTANAAPTPQMNWFEGGISTESNAYKTGGNAFCTIQTSIQETATGRRVFYTNITPVSKIGVDIKEKGTGDWTLTLHDDADNVLSSNTIANASLKNNQVNFFEFATALDLNVNTSTTTTPNSRQYHFHLTSTIADGSIISTTDGSLGDCNFQIYATALINPTNGLHPMMRFLNGIMIANGRYVTFYEPLQDVPTTADFERARIILPPGFETTGFAQKNMLAVIGGEQRSSTGQFQDGALFFWNGSADSYIDWWPVAEGSPQSLFSYKNTAWYVAGGYLWRIKGLDEPQPKRRFRNTDSEFTSINDTTHNYPHMLTVRRGVLLAGYASQTTNTTLEQAVYSYGSSSPEYPDSFGNSYTPSHGVRYNDGSNNLRIGMVRNYNDTLFISWRNGDTYGVDVVNNSSAPASTGTLESLKFYGMDSKGNARPQFKKKAEYLLATFDSTLPEGVEIKLKYRIDGSESDDWEYSSAFTNGQFAFFDIGLEFLGIEFGIDITCTGTVSPEISSLYLFYDPMLGSASVNHG